MAPIATSAGIPGFQSRPHLGNARHNHRFTAPVSPRWNVSISSEGKVKNQTLSRAASSDVSPRPPSNRPPIFPIIRNGSNIYYIEWRRREIKARYCRPTMATIWMNDSRLMHRWSPWSHYESGRSPGQPRVWSMGCSGASQHKNSWKISHPALSGCFQAVWGSRIPGFAVLDGVKDTPVGFLVPRPLRFHYLLCKYGVAWIAALNSLPEATVCLC